MDFTNLETVFSAIEMSEVFGTLADLGSQQLAEAKESLLRIIAMTLDKSQKLNLQWGVEHRILASGPAGYSELADFVTALNEKPGRHRASFITFNYDVGLEIALGARSLPYSYCLDSPPHAHEHPVCKLHGSLNWVGNSAGIKSFDPVAELQLQAKGKRPSTWFLDTSHGRGRLLGTHPNDSLPLIVPPAESKSQFRSQMAKVWQVAIRSFQEAEIICFVGYSIPPSDNFFRLLVGLGMISDTMIRRVHVVNPAGDAVERTLELIRPLSVNRKSVVFQPTNDLHSLLRELGDAYRTSGGFM